MACLTLNEVIRRATLKHKNKYGYSLVDYINLNLKVKIICPEHGIYLQSMNAHINQGQGCPKCVGKSKTTSDIITEFKKIHADKYGYSLVNYNGVDIPVTIICDKHGEFKQLPRNHRKGHGCKLCSVDKSAIRYKKPTRQFINEVNQTHSNKYGYADIKYLNEKTAIIVECSIHSKFKILPNNHLHKGSGCPKCAQYGFNPDKEATLYYIKDKDTGLYKIGITNNSLNNRFGKAFLESRAEILMEETYENGQDAYLAEQEILQAFKPYRCNNDTWPEAKGGKTEFFNRNILEL